MANGKVKWFNNAKGYGFILPDSGESDLFVHYSSIEMSGYRTLKAGQDVEFDMQEGPKGYHAVNIRAQHDPDADDAVEAQVEATSEFSSDREPDQESGAESRQETETEPEPEEEAQIEDAPREPEVTLEDTQQAQPDAEQPPREGAAGSG
jgi:CspA family cold shock protein